jgi:hypothetical protein
MHEKQKHQPRKGDRECNTLTGGEKFKLWQTLVEAKGELEAVRADFPQAAEMLTQRLGFKVTKNNIRDAVKKGIVDWKRAARGSTLGLKKTLEDRIDQEVSAFNTRLKSIQERLVAVEDMILRLCAASGTNGKVEPMRAPEAWVSK